MPIAQHAVRQPVCSIINCTSGSRMMEPMPTPAKAIPMARPRLRTNQFGRNNDWPEYPRQTLPPPTSTPMVK